MKLKRLGELGEVRFVNPYEPDEVAATLRGWPVFVVSSAWRRAKRAIKHSALLASRCACAR